MNTATLITSNANQRSNDAVFYPFPYGIVDGVFADYCDAYAGRCEVPTSFLFATLKAVIGATLGGRVYLDETEPLYPNLFTCCVANAHVEQARTALLLAEAMLSRSDPAVSVLRLVPTPRQLTAQLNKGKNGTRVILSAEVFSHVAKKMDGWSDPAVMNHPHLSMIAVSMKRDNLTGRLANRVAYYTSSGDFDWMFETQPGDNALLGRVAREVNDMQVKYPKPTPFSFDSLTDEAGAVWYRDNKDPHTLERVKWLALFFSALDNKEGDHRIHIRAFDKALMLVDYLQEIEHLDIR